MLVAVSKIDLIVYGIYFLYMGLEDIAYDLIKDLIKEFRASKSDRQKQIEIATSLVKKTYLRFNFEWTTELESERTEGRFEGQRQILSQYSQLFLNLAVEINDVLPKESERMKNIATQMKRGAYGILTHSSNQITPIGNKCAAEVMNYIEDIQ